MSEIVPPSLVGQDFFNASSHDYWAPETNRAADSKIHEVVLTCIERSPTGLFMSSSSVEIVLSQIEVVMGQILVMEIDREKKIRKRGWHKRSTEGEP